MKNVRLVFILLVLLPGIVQAQPQEKTGYVTDILFLTLRDGPGKNFAVKKIIKSNDPVGILEEENDYFKVETDDGDTGWVEKQYIIYTVPKSQVIEELNQTIEKLESRVQTLIANQDPLQKQITDQQDTFKDKITSLETELQILRGEQEKLLTEKSLLQKEYDTLIEKSKYVLDTQTENETLKKENTRLSARVNETENQGNDQMKTGMIKWFLAGVGVLLLGWLLGHSLSSRRKRSGSLLN